MNRFSKRPVLVEMTTWRWILTYFENGYFLGLVILILWMIAFNAFGLIGVIDELLNNSIKIIPLHDASIKVPAKNSRTLENIIIVGTGKPKTFQIEAFKKNGDIKKGDEIISSGLGGRFPEGFFLGRVAEIKENDQSNFLLITVENTFDFSFGSTILFTKP